MRKKSLFLVVFLTAIAWNNWGQNLEYYPCSKKTSRPDTLVTKTLLENLVKSQSWQLLADVPGMGKEGDTRYAFVVFGDGGKAAAVFNRDDASYLIGWHQPLAKRRNDHHHFSFAYAELFNASVWKKGGSDLQLKLIADSLKADIRPLNRKNLELLTINH